MWGGIPCKIASVDEDPAKVMRCEVQRAAALVGEAACNERLSKKLRALADRRSVVCSPTRRRWNRSGDGRFQHSLVVVVGDDERHGAVLGLRCAR